MPTKSLPSTLDTPPASAAAERVADILSERIRSGQYAVGDLLPAERALAADLQVHRRSVRLAIERLVRDGKVTHRPHCRPTVGGTPKSVREAPRPKPAASISTSNLIALIFCCGGEPLDRTGAAQKRIYWGMTEALMKRGYHGVFLNWGDLGTEDENAEHEAQHLKYIYDQGFGGALFFAWAYRRNHDLVREVNKSVPIVLLDRNLVGTDMDYVGVQNHAGISEITRHLIDQGHRRIAYFTTREPINPMLDRAIGYSDVMRSAGLDGIHEMIVTVLHYPDDRAWVATDAVFRLPKHERPTAAVCFTDFLAARVAQRIEFLGLSVPGDVTVTGFDDVLPALPNGIGLTTMAQPFEEIGKKAVEVLMRRIENPHLPPITVELPAQLIVRESSRKPSTT